MSSILDHSSISGKYFFPQQRALKSPFWVRVEDVELACYHRVVDASGFTLIHFHGNGESVADYVPTMANLFGGLGLNQLFVEYREYGGSTGQAQLVAMLGDGEAVMRAAGVAPEKAIVFGRSLGSLYAIELASKHPGIAGLIIESGIADPCERFLTYADLDSSGTSEAEVQAEVAKHFDHKTKLSAYTHPLLILHTENDGLIDISHAERNYAWAASQPKRLARFSKGNHNTIFRANADDYLDELKEFIAEL